MTTVVDTQVDTIGAFSPASLEACLPVAQDSQNKVVGRRRRRQRLTWRYCKARGYACPAHRQAPPGHRILRGVCPLGLGLCFQLPPWTFTQQWVSTGLPFLLASFLLNQTKVWVLLTDYFFCFAYPRWSVLFCCCCFLNISYSLCTKSYLLLHLKIPNDLLICFLEPTPRSYPSLPGTLLPSSLGHLGLLATHQTIFSRSPLVHWSAVASSGLTSPCLRMLWPWSQSFRRSSQCPLVIAVSS